MAIPPKSVVRAALIGGALIAAPYGGSSAHAQSAATLVVPSKSLGRLALGQTPAQVRRVLGKPDKTLRLSNGLLDDIYDAVKYYLDGVQLGLAFESQPSQDNWFEGSPAHALIIHRRGAEVIPDAGGEFISTVARVPPEDG